LPRGIHECFLTSRCSPAVFSAPIMVAEDKVAGGARSGDHVHLGGEPPFRIPAGCIVRWRQSTRVHIVTEEEDDPFGTPRGKVATEGAKHRLTGGVGRSCVANQVQTCRHLLRW
jgi:hypothetical protein